MHTRTILLSLALSAGGAAAGNPMPELVPHIQFDRSGPEPTLARLKGKAALVVFMQSWCPICNEWAPRMFREVEAAHGGNRGLVLIAIKTDGGGVAGAKNYLSAHGGDPDRWIVGADPDAAYYKRLFPANDLYTYVLVGPDGERVGQGSAGAFWSSGPKLGRFVLSDADLLAPCGPGPLVTVLPAERTYPPELSRAVRFAELGFLGPALAACAPGGRPSAEVAAAQKQLRDDITAIAEARMRRCSDVVKNAAGDGGERYDAVRELTELVADCPSAPAANEARTVLSRAASDPAILKEKGAEAAYWMAVRSFEKSGQRDRARLRLQLESIARVHPGTRFGRRAEEESKR